MSQAQSGSGYPRPDWQRYNQGSASSPLFGWQSLNGRWSFAFDDKDVGLKQAWYKRTAADRQTFPRDIQVPFAFQTQASGIHERRDSEVIWYAIDVPLSPDLETFENRESQTVLRFGAVDYQATVWAAGELVAQHRGGHVPFQADVTAQAQQARASKSALTLVVRVEDRLRDLTQPRGKQYWRPKSESIFYTPTSGIWQDVWLEQIPETRTERAIIVPDIDRGSLSIDAYLTGTRNISGLSLTVEVRLGDLDVVSATKQVPAGATQVRFDLNMSLTGVASPEEVLSSIEQMPDSNSQIVPQAISGETWQDGIALWTPERPALYDIRLIIKRQGSPDHVDRVSTHAGMRKISTDGGLLKLNNKPYFQRLVLDQGYWPETGLTPPSSDALRRDILLMKEIGINGARKHQKVEHPAFLYWADRLGFLVWGEMANAYQFLQDYQERFAEEWQAAVRRDMNHPSIVAWVPVNESWAHNAIATRPEQASFLRALYHLTKSIDPSRPVVDNDGWEHVETDLMTVHDYADGPALGVTCSSQEGLLAPKGGKDVNIKPSDYLGQPILLSEFGGIAYDPSQSKKHGKAGGSEDWGYHTAQSEEAYLQALEGVVHAAVDGGIVQGFCYTQHSDVEQEVNGLLTADRRHKADPEKVRAIFSRRSRFEA